MPSSPRPCAAPAHATPPPETAPAEHAAPPAHRRSVSVLTPRIRDPTRFFGLGLMTAATCSGLTGHPGHSDRDAGESAWTSPQHSQPTSPRSPELDDPGIDLKAQLPQLIADVRHAVASYLGMRMTIALDGNEVSFTIHHATGSIAASLRLPLTAFSPTETGSNLVLYAATSGAFIDLAADLSYALGLHLHPAALPTDDDLTLPVRGSGITGLNRQSTINQALGVLIDLGRTPEPGARN